VLRWCAVAAEFGGYDRAATRRQDRRARRPVCRHEGAVRRVLLRGGSKPRRGHRLGEALPVEQIRIDRDPSGFRREHGPKGLRVVDSVHRAAERVARESYGRLIAMLAARTRDVAGAEDALGDAFAAALRTWPVDGVPGNPDAWLLTAARRRQTDDIRKRQVRVAAEEHVKLMISEIEAMSQGRDAIPDRRLALMFACAHPGIDPGIRTPLILQTVLGLTAEDIAAAFL